MSGNKKKLIAFDYFGGMFISLEHIYANFPSGFSHLVDLFAGSFVVPLNYPGSVIRTANEINGEVTNFFEVLRDHEDELLRLIRLTPCSALEYRGCWGTSDISDLERARRFYVRVRQSFFGLGVQMKGDCRFRVLYDLYPKVYRMAMNYTNNDVTYRTALRRMGVELPDEMQRLF